MRKKDSKSTLMLNRIRQSGELGSEARVLHFHLPHSSPRKQLAVRWVLLLSVCQRAPRKRQCLTMVCMLCKHRRVVNRIAQ